MIIPDDHPPFRYAQLITFYFTYFTYYWMSGFELIILMLYIYKLKKCEDQYSTRMIWYAFRLTLIHFNLYIKEYYKSIKGLIFFLDRLFYNKIV